MNDPRKNVVARDLMVETTRTIRVDASLQEAMELLVEAQSDPTLPNALIVMDSSDSYVGVLTARLLFRSLLTLWEPTRAIIGDDTLLEHELLKVARERSGVSVGDALVRGLPTAKPDDRLLNLIFIGAEEKMEFIPVLENGTAVGLVPITRVLQSAASLALTPDDEGIRLDGKNVK